MFSLLLFRLLLCHHFIFCVSKWCATESASTLTKSSSLAPYIIVLESQNFINLKNILVKIFCCCYPVLGDNIQWLEFVPSTITEFKFRKLISKTHCNTTLMSPLHSACINVLLSSLVCSKENPIHMNTQYLDNTKVCMKFIQVEH